MKKQKPHENSAEPDDATKQTARVTLKPSFNAATVIAEYGSFLGQQDIVALATTLDEAIQQPDQNNMKQCEAMLISQAQALQTIFVSVSRRAAKQEYIKNYEVFLKLALKAQTQCRMTLETLAAIKNPPIVFARQANIANGHQQINNENVVSLNPTRAEKNQLMQNELLEENNEQWLDNRTTKTSSGNDSKLEAVATVNRAKI